MTTTGARTAGDVQVTEIDGIPAVWVDSQGPYAAGMLLRVGHADETLPRHGITHMLEHLALHGVERPGEHSNGHVDATTFAVHMTGGPDDAAQFLVRVARQLVDPPVERLDDEKGVLRAERAQRPGHPLAEMHAWRWGVRGYGLDVAEEYGLPLLTAEAVREWAATHVSRQNAVLWFSGPPPAGLRLALPDGVHRLPPDPYASPLPTFPAYYRSEAPVVVTHGLVHRSTAANTLVGVLQNRLVDELRVARAAAYSPQVGYRPMCGDVAEVITFSDIVDGRERDVVEQVLASVGDLAWRGSTVRPEELDAHRATVRRSLGPGAEAGLVTAAAWNLVHGARVRTVEELLAELDGVTPDDVQAAGRELADTLLAQVPRTAPVPPPMWNPAPLSPAAPVVAGRRHVRLDGGAALRVAPIGVTLTEGAASLTVRHDRAAALAQWDDGGRILIGEDGVHLRIEPTHWGRGRRLVAAIDAVTPEERTVPLGERPAVPRVPLRRRLRRWTRTLAVPALVVVAVGVVAALVTAGGGTSPVPVLGLALGLTAVVASRRRT